MTDELPILTASGYLTEFSQYLTENCKVLGDQTPKRSGNNRNKIAGPVGISYIDNEINAFRSHDLRLSSQAQALLYRVKHDSEDRRDILTTLRAQLC